jgi:Prokaryotic phospholipase A2
MKRKRRTCENSSKECTRFRQCNDGANCLYDLGYRTLLSIRQLLADGALSYSGPINWTGDGCSGPISGYFRPACLKHDFGYRNWRRVGLGRRNWTYSFSKVFIDGVLTKDMTNTCAHHVGWFGKPKCFLQVPVASAAVIALGYPNRGVNDGPRYGELPWNQ